MVVWPGYNYLGPGSGDDYGRTPRNILDAIARQHDMDYAEIIAREGTTEAYLRYNWADERMLQSMDRMPIWEKLRLLPEYIAAKSAFIFKKDIKPLTDLVDLVYKHLKSGDRKRKRVENDPYAEEKEKEEEGWLVYFQDMFNDWNLFFQFQFPNIKSRYDPNSNPEFYAAMLAPSLRFDSSSEYQTFYGAPTTVKHYVTPEKQVLESYGKLKIIL